jgi:LysR family transcriptional regulator, glycine cleavage system transcriptional activator
LRVPHKHNWYFACSGENKNKNKIKRFEDWLVKQVAADPALEILKDDKK